MKAFKSTLLYMMILLIAGCGGTTGGNPGATVTLESTAYTNNGTLVQVKTPVQRFFEAINPIEDAYAASVTSFKFCITQLKIVSSVGGAPSSTREAILGLVDVSDATKITNWGNVNLVDGESISELHLEIHKDADNCSGANYSLTYNGKDLSKDLEFKFKFNPAIQVTHGKTLQLNLSVIAKAMEDADVAGELDDQRVSNYLQESTFGTGTELPD